MLAASSLHADPNLPPTLPEPAQVNGEALQPNPKPPILPPISIYRVRKAIGQCYSILEWGLALFPLKLQIGSLFPPVKKGKVFTTEGNQ